MGTYRPRSDESATTLRFGGVGRVLPPLIQIDAAAPGLARGINGEERLNTLALTADGEGVEKLVPAFRSFLQIRSLRAALQPSVQFQRHRCEELPLVHSISQMVTIGAAAGVFWRPNLNCRHSLTDGVYDLLGNTLGLFRAGASLFESGVEIRKRLVFRGGRLAAGIWRTRASLPLTLFRCCHGIMVAEAGGSAKDRNASDFRLGSILRPTLESLRPFSIGLRFTLPHYNWYLEKIVSVVPLRAVQCALITVSRDVN